MGDDTWVSKAACASTSAAWRAVNEPSCAGYTKLNGHDRSTTQTQTSAQLPAAHQHFSQLHGQRFLPFYAGNTSSRPSAIYPTKTPGSLVIQHWAGFQSKQGCGLNQRLLVVTVDLLKPICLGLIKNRLVFYTLHELLQREHLYYPVGEHDARGWGGTGALETKGHPELGSWASSIAMDGDPKTAPGHLPQKPTTLTAKNKNTDFVHSDGTPRVLLCAPRAGNPRTPHPKNKKSHLEPNSLPVFLQQGRPAEPLCLPGRFTRGLHTREAWL